MQTKRTGIALPPMLCSEFVKYVLNRHRAPTTLLVCSTKEVFLEDLLSSFRKSQCLSASQSSDGQTVQDPLLIPTIHLIARSSSVHLVFVPTLPHLRAYLATHVLASGSAASVVTNPGNQAPLLGIWGLACLHRSTAEHSAQGVSRTLGLAIEAASFSDQMLVLGEPRKTHEAGELDDTDLPDTTTTDPWKDKVPLLSGSIRFGGEHRAWAGKTVEVEHVVAKWCKFVRLDQVSEAT